MYQMDWLEKGDHRQYQEKGREAEHDIHETHEDIIDPARIVTGKQSDHGSDNHGDTGRNKPHLKGYAGAVDHPRQDIAAQVIGPEPVGG